MRQRKHDTAQSAVIYTYRERALIIHAYQVKTSVSRGVNHWGRNFGFVAPVTVLLSTEPRPIASVTQ